MKKILSLILAAGVLSSCASIINGTTQDYVINTSPAGAQVYINGVPLQKTPTVMKLKRGTTHTLMLEKEGYEEVCTTIDRSMSGWVWMNVAMGGILFSPILFVVDVCTGGAFTLDEIPQGRIVMQPKKK